MSEKCPVCQSLDKQNYSLGVVNSPVWFECKSCWHVWIANLNLKDPVYDANYNKHFRRPQDAVKAGAVVGQIASVIEKYNLDKSILEVGPGNAWSAWMLRQAGYDISTAEIHPLQILYVRNSVMVPCNTFDSYLIQKNRKFALVYASHVIEHVRNFARFLQNCKSVLKENGVIFLDTPCVDLAPSNLLEWHHCNTREPFEHVNLFSSLSLRLAAQEAGLSIKDMKLMGDWGSMHAILGVSDAG